ncbi:hypothetical protein Bbelb_208290 [Branchiostoma belcheri]|nr:hypothetical protein Bbelb_208290 [Branchiostoma belcheri]
MITAPGPRVVLPGALLTSKGRRGMGVAGVNSQAASHGAPAARNVRHAKWRSGRPSASPGHRFTPEETKIRTFEARSVVPPNLTLSACCCSLGGSSARLQHAMARLAPPPPADDNELGLQRSSMCNSATHRMFTVKTGLRGRIQQCI